MELNIKVRKLFDWKYLPHLIVLSKVIFMTLFSSDFQDKLFIPFVSHFLDNFDNPWQFVFEQSSGVEFPYHPLMLLLLSICYAPVHFLFGDNALLANLFFKLPVLAADIFIFYLLLKSFGGKRKEIILFYFASPIIFYASYLHSQLDLIPTALLFASIYFLLKNKWGYAALFFGLAASSKLHIVAAAPLLMIYWLRRDKYKEVLYFSATAFAVYLLFLLPFFSEGFVQLVFQNPKQRSVIQSAIEIANIKIILPLLAVALIYSRFLLYKKINNDLLFTFLAILFSLFVVLIPPSPAWYVWVFPFLSIFFIRNYPPNTKIIYLYYLLNIGYLVFFVFFYIPDFQDLNFLGTALDLKIRNADLNSAMFTFLAATLLACIYAFYNFGVRSNSIYKKENSTIIGIGGDSGSGKTTLLSDLKLILGNKLTEIEGDGDHKWERNNDNWNDITHLNPKANFLHRQSENLMALKSGKAIYRSDYDHSTGKFTTPKKIVPKEYITICGLHPFYLPVMRKIIDLKIFVDTDERLRQHWKIVRDTKKRGYSKEQILSQLNKRESDSLKYISPQKNFADLVVSYFTEEDFETGNESIDPRVKLKLVLQADIHLDPLVKKLYDCQVEASWDYAEDLQTQYLILHNPLSLELIHEIAKEVIPNLEELIPQEVEWKEGYRGFVQMVVVYSLSELMRTTE